MTDIAALVADNIHIWTGAIQRKSGAGRGGGKRISLYGIGRLRALILELAVRGKLVPQDASDEPASELLKRVKAERAKLIKSETIGKGKAFALVSQTPPFEIPSNWIWTQISEIGHDWGQREPSSAFTYIDVGSIDQTLGVVQSPNVIAAKDAPSRARKVVRKGTVLYSTVRPYLLNISIVDQDFDPEPIASTAFAIIHPFAGIEAGFVYRYLRSATFVSYVESCQTGIAYPAINDRQFFAAWCPLPPLAEQGRIVAKVDELMALCDSLERESAGAMAAHQALVDVLLATLVKSTDAADLARQWARLERHFDTLFTTDASIDALKQTILDLAVRGKLVKQDEGDEPANAAFARVKILKQKLIAERKIRKDKPTQPIDSAELPFTIPKGWLWSRVGDIAVSTEYGTSRKASSGDDGVTILAMGNIQNGVVNLESDKTIPYDSDELPELLLRNGDILYNRTNSYELVGKTGIFRFDSDDYTFASYLIRIRLDQQSAEPEFLNFSMNAPYFRQTQVVPRITKQTGQANVSGGAMRNMLVPVPPLPEQRRIVAKVDALMALCDALKAGLADAAGTQRHLADAITERAAA